MRKTNLLFYNQNFSFKMERTPKTFQINYCEINEAKDYSFTLLAKFKFVA